jgi:hypothetical protein
MTELPPVWHVQDVTGATAPTYNEPPTPAYSDLIHFAAVGRALTIYAGYALDQRPPAAIVRRALRRQGLLTETEERTQ